MKFRQGKYISICLILMILVSYQSAFCQCGLKGDINDDGKIGLEEAVYALQIVAGIRNSVEKYYIVTPEIADNPAVQLFSNDINAKLDNWFLNASEHWKNRQDTSWEDYISVLTSPNPPINPPNPPQPPAKPVEQICEATGEGRCFYIDAAKGDDANPGTFDSPWETYLNIVFYYGSLEPANHINKRYGGLKPGDTVYFMSGEYSDTYVYGVASRELFGGFNLQHLSGDESYPITFKAYPGEHPVFSARRIQNPLTRSPEQRAIDQYDGTIMSAVYIRGDNLIIDGFEISNTYATGINVWGTNIEIKNCWIHDIDGWNNENLAGIAVTGSVDIKIHGNLLYDNYDHLFSNNGLNLNSGHIVFFSGGGHHRIYNNIIWFSKADGTGNYYDKGFGIKYKHSADLENSKFEVDHNAIWNCSFHSIGSGSFGNRIHHNLILESGGSAIYFTDFGGPTNNSDTIVEHNSIVNIELSNEALLYNPSDVYNPIGLLAFRNNILIEADTYTPYHSERGIVSICIYCDDDTFDKVVTSGNLAFDNNLYFNQNVDLNNQKVWLLFSANNDQYNSRPHYGVKGDRYNFQEWQTVGYDNNSKAY